MFKKIITTIPATSDSGMLCADCYFCRTTLQRDGNVKECCNYYQKICDSNKPLFCNVELIEVTEGLGPGPGPVFYDRNNEPIQAPEISTVEIHELCDDLHNRYGMNRDAHTEIEELIADWLEDKKIKIKR